MDNRLQFTNLKAAEALIRRHPPLEALIDAEATREASDHGSALSRWYTLLQPDQQLREGFLEAHPGASVHMVDNFLAQIETARFDHPYLMQHSQTEFIATTTGGNVLDCLQASEISGAYLLTDMQVRWEQIRALLGERGEVASKGSRVAHALESLPLPMAASLNGELAARLREEQRLSEIRSLLDRIMYRANGAEPLSVDEAALFAEEFRAAVGEAELEYKKINDELSKTFRDGTLATLGVSGFVGGHLSIALGVMAMTGVRSLIKARRDRAHVKKHFPASMLMRFPK